MLANYMKIWTSWAGWPSVVSSDRGLHNRGQFARGLTANGCYVRQAGLENPEAIGRGERHGSIWKTTFKHVVKAHKITGKTQMKLACDIVNSTKNSSVRTGGFSPQQWVLGKHPRFPGALLDEQEYGQLVTIQGHLDGATVLGMRANLRFTAQKDSVK